MMSAAEIYCCRNCGCVLKSGFLTCETVQNDGSSRWSCSFLVLTRKDQVVQLARFVSPDLNQPLEEMEVASVESSREPGLVLTVHPRHVLDSKWLIRCSSVDEHQQWMEAFELALAGDLSKFQTNIDRVNREKAKSTCKRSTATSWNDSLGPGSSTIASFLPGVVIGAQDVSATHSQRLDEFQFHFGEGTTEEDLRKRVIGGGLWKALIRSICWRRLLGVISKEMSTWGPMMTSQRISYDRLMGQHLITPEMLESLKQTNIDESVAQAFAENKTIEFQIWKDLERTRVEGNMREDIKEVMLRILLVWAKANPKVGYMQGMNEILLVILMVLHDEYFSAKDIVGKPKLTNQYKSYGHLVNLLCDREYIEHDAYVLLDAVLKRLRPIFSPMEEYKEEQGLPVKLEHIQHVLLQRTDPELAAHLHVIGLEPHMFLIRWIRVMFAREIDMPQLLLVWDAIFAMAPNDFNLIDSVGVGLLVEPSVRSALMRVYDGPDALQIVKNLPKLTEDQVTKLIYEARKIHLAHERSVQIVEVQLKRQNDRKRRSLSAHDLLEPSNHELGGGALSRALPQVKGRNHSLVETSKDGGKDENVRRVRERTSSGDWFCVDSLEAEFWDEHMARSTSSSSPSKPMGTKSAASSTNNNVTTSPLDKLKKKTLHLLRKTQFRISR